MSLAILFWLVYSFPALLSLLVMIAAPASVLSAILALVAVGPVRAVAAARERLAAQGMSLGL